MNTSRTLTLFLAVVLLGFVFLALSTPTARAADPTIVRVKVGGATSGSCGGTWDTACGLQYALTSTVGTAELWVAAGTYKPTMGVSRTISFQLRNGIALYGGFAMTETLRTQRNFTANVTILSGDIGVPDDSSDNAYHVVTGNGVSNTAVLDGFTVMGGNADGLGYSDDYGGGMYEFGGSPTLANVAFISNTAEYGAGIFNQSNSNPALFNVTFRGNSAYTGGALYNGGSSPTLTNVTFSGNSARNGAAAMFNYQSNPTLTNVTFISNTAGYYGGGMHNDSSSPTLTNVTFSGNSSSADGGGMSNNTSSPTLTNVTFASNWSSHGGGLYNYSGSPALTNVTFSANSASSMGGGMYNESSNSTIRNAIFWGNSAPDGSQIFTFGITPGISDSVVEGGYAGGTNILSADPHLGALGDWGGSTQTVPLLPGSSAIDAGNDATCAATDQRGKPRVGACDIGAFESQGFTLTKTSGDNQSTVVNSAFASPLGVAVSSASAEPVDGGVVRFAAPSSGASAIPGTSTVTIASGVVTRTLTANGTVGSYVVTASAAGASASASFALTNTKHDTTTVITSSANPSVLGQTVTLTAAVSGASLSGSVAFKDGGATLADCGNVALSGGTAQCTVSSLAPGSHAITAVYSGDANNNASTSAVYTQNVDSIDYFLPLLRR